MSRSLRPAMSINNVWCSFNLYIKNHILYIICKMLLWKYFLKLIFFFNTQNDFLFTWRYITLRKTSCKKSTFAYRSNSHGAYFQSGVATRGEGFEHPQKSTTTSFFTIRANAGRGQRLMSIGFGTDFSHGGAFIFMNNTNVRESLWSRNKAVE